MVSKRSGSGLGTGLGLGSGSGLGSGLVSRLGPGSGLFIIGISKNVI